MRRHGDSEGRALEAFLDHFGISPVRPDRDLLGVLGEAFVQLPYENLTKLIRKQSCPPGPTRRRMPETIITEHVSLGAGGTCFALTYFFCSVLRGIGYRCAPLLADMRNRPRSHCALLVQLDDGPHLLDPAYLVTTPLAIGSGQPGQSDAQRGATAARLVVDPAGRSAELHTGGKWRYRAELASVSQREFFAVWDASFDWTMMNAIHVCAASAEGYAYLHGHKLRWQGKHEKHTANIRGDEARVLLERFGIAPQLVEQARAVIDAERRAARRATGGR